jgi:hypothetical protein
MADEVVIFAEVLRLCDRAACLSRQPIGTSIEDNVIDVTATVAEWSDEELRRTLLENLRAVKFLADRGARAPIESLRQLDRIRAEMARRGLPEPRLGGS